MRAGLAVSRTGPTRLPSVSDARYGDSPDHHGTRHDAAGTVSAQGSVSAVPPKSTTRSGHPAVRPGVYRHRLPSERAAAAGDDDLGLVAGDADRTPEPVKLRVLTLPSLAALVLDLDGGAATPASPARPARPPRS